MENKDAQLASNLEIEIIGVHTICRLCANSNDRLIGIYGDEGVANDLANKINMYMPVKVAVADELPLQCCWNCASTVLAWHELVLTCVETDRRFRNPQIVAEKPLEQEDKGVFELGNRAGDDSNGIKEEIKMEIEFVETIEDNKPLIDLPSTDSNRCDICGKTVSRSRDLKRHKITCHKIKDTPLETSQSNETKRIRRTKQEIEPQFFCEFCEKGFTRKNTLQKHKAKVHALECPPKPTNSEILNKCRNRTSDGKTFFQCDFCQKNFNQSYNMMRHRTMHTGVNAYCCHICGRRFRMSNGLKRHIETLHRGIKRYTCEVCKKGFTTGASRDEHMNIHTNNRPFVCEECGKCFKQKASLHVHKLFHSDLWRFECTSCGKKFRRAQDLKIHGWIHTGHKPHECDKCKMTFRLRFELTNHMKVHQKGKECVCNECGSVFSQERYLKRHRKIHERHLVVAKEEVDNDDTKL